jgi:DedD protein
MDQKLKQRLTGAIILVALAVIFVPIILEGPDDEWTPRSHSVPEQPQIDYRASMELDLPEQTTPAVEYSAGAVTEALNLKQQEQAANEANQDEPQQATAKLVEPVVAPAPAVKTPPPTAKAAPEPVSKAAKVTAPPIQGWFVQVGSFGQEMNASGLSTRLQSAGYDTRLQKIEIGKGYAYRVLVGPASSRRAAEKLADQLKSGQQLAGMVIEYP